MTAADNKKREALGRLADALVDDILAATDEEILAEVAEENGGLAKAIEDTRTLFDNSVANAKKARLGAAQAGLAASRSAPVAWNLVDMASARKQLRRALAACSPDDRVTLAARNESELTDLDVLGMLQDLAELGICLPTTKATADLETYHPS